MRWDLGSFQYERVDSNFAVARLRPDGTTWHHFRDSKRRRAKDVYALCEPATNHAIRLEIASIDVSGDYRTQAPALSPNATAERRMIIKQFSTEHLLRRGS